jgi:hypothetical protein
LWSNVMEIFTRMPLDLHKLNNYGLVNPLNFFTLYSLLFTIIL